MGEQNLKTENQQQADYGQFVADLHVQLEDTREIVNQQIEIIGEQTKKLVTAQESLVKNQNELEDEEYARESMHIECHFDIKNTPRKLEGLKTEDKALGE